MERRRLLLLLLLGFLIIAGVRAVYFKASWMPILGRPIPTDVGMGAGLKEMVLELEKRIGGRIAYEINGQGDPLNLSRVVRAQNLGAAHPSEIAENLKEMRLSCTILSPKKTIAIIKFQGQSYILGIGDEINQRKVVAIDKKQVVLSHNGSEEILFNRSAPLAEIKSQQKVKTSDLKL